MKKIIASLFALVLALNTFGQDASAGPEFRKHRFGLIGTPGVSYLGINKPGSENKGLGYHIAGGLNYEFSFSRSVALATGLLFAQTTGKVEYTDPVSLKYERVFEGNSDPDTAFRIHSRTYVFNSIDIPLKFKFRTPEIGYMTYYGEFGSTLNVITGAYARKNLVTQNEGDTKALLSDNESRLDASGESRFFRLGVNFGAGVEWNVAGNTSLLMGLNGNLGYTNILKKESKDIKYDGGNGSSFLRATNLNYIALMVGVQF